MLIQGMLCSDIYHGHGEGVSLSNLARFSIKLCSEMGAQGFVTKMMVLSQQTLQFCRLTEV